MKILAIICYIVSVGGCIAIHWHQGTLNLDFLRDAMTFASAGAGLVFLSLAGWK